LVKNLVNLTPCVPLSLVNLLKERGKIFREGLAPLSAGYSPWGWAGLKLRDKQKM